MAISDETLSELITRMSTEMPEFFRPVTTRATVTPTFTNGALVDFAIIQAGIGYKSSPLITLVSTTGSGALTNSFITDGKLTDTVVVAGGENYVSSDTALVSNRQYSDAYLKRFLGIAGFIHGRYEIATVFAAAHFITLDQGKGGEEDTGEVDGGVGQIKEVETGEMSIEYFQKAMQDEGDEFWEPSYYGRMFQMLERRALLPTFHVV